MGHKTDWAEEKRILTFASDSEDCGIVFYDCKTGKELGREPFDVDGRIGRLNRKKITNWNQKEISYLFYEDGHLIPDFRARAFAKKIPFGKQSHLEDFRAVFPIEEFDWEGDQFPSLSYEESVAYCLHVRGFTKHASSGVSNRGTFRGIVEKIPYLKAIGVTTLELMPAYAFSEVQTEWESDASKILGVPKGFEENGKMNPPKLNYWGYKKAFYYTPKPSYAADANAVNEFKFLVRELHKNGMELMMQFYFPENVNRLEIPEILHFWVQEYHVDGFHLLGIGIPADYLAQDDCLARTKLWYENFVEEKRDVFSDDLTKKHLAVYRDDYIYTVRRFLKGDEGLQDAVLSQMRTLRTDAGRIHYLSNYSGFTLYDSFSYDRKHNESNGEKNRDGTDYNCSWNCGEEGATRKTKVKELRLKQMKNAFCLLLFTASTPLIFMGDEFGNSQKGNNNPYCQDNSISWLDWSLLEKNKEIFDAWTFLVAFRKNHRILSPEKPYRLMDSAACGYPDLSYHGESAWKAQTEYYSRTVGLLYCGKYAKNTNGKDDDFIYLGMNLHWEKHTLALPRLPKGFAWKKIYSTVPDSEPEQLSSSSDCTLDARSIHIYLGIPQKEEKAKSKKKDFKGSK